MGKEKIRALKIEPMKHPKVCYIEPSVKAFWRAVNVDNIKDGGIEAKKLERNVYAFLYSALLPFFSVEIIIASPSVTSRREPIGMGLPSISVESVIIPKTPHSVFLVRSPRSRSVRTPQSSPGFPLSPL